MKMIDFGKTIYWKLLLTLLACIFVSSVVISGAYWIFGAQIEVHPQIRKSLLLETHKIADQVAISLESPATSLQSIAREIHDKVPIPREQRVDCRQVRPATLLLL